MCVCVYYVYILCCVGQRAIRGSLHPFYHVGAEAG